MPDLATRPARLPFRVYFELAEPVEVFAESPEAARLAARRKAPDDPGKITKVKRVKEMADA